MNPNKNYKRGKALSKKFPVSLLIRLILLVFILICSVVLNAILFRAALDFYRETNEVRLDPLGLRRIPPAASSASLHQKRPIIVFLGDSRVADWPMPEDSPPRVYLNCGIGGQTTTQILARYPFHVRPLTPDVVVLQLGINDLKTVALFPEQKETIIADCKMNIRHLIENARKDGASIVLTTILLPGEPPLERLPVWSNDVLGAIDEVNRDLLTLEGKGVTVVNAARLLQDEGGLTARRYRKDFLHLNRDAYAVLNRALLPALENALTYRRQQTALSRKT